MGSIFNPTAVSLLLSSTDRLVAKNAAAGLSPTAAHLIALGEGAGANVGASGAFYVLLGVNAGVGLNVATDIIAVGQNALSGGLQSANASGTIVLGSGALPLYTTCASAASTIAIGRDVAPLLVQGHGNIAIGANTLRNLIGTGNPSEYSTVIGMNAGGRSVAALTPDAAALLESVVIGYQADLQTTAATNIGASRLRHVMIGVRAGRDYQQSGNSTSTSSVLIGWEAGRDSYGNSDVIVGAQARATLTPGSGGSNVIIGASAASNSGSANPSSNVLIGASSLTNGSQSVVIGAVAGNGNGEGNVILGYSACSVNTLAGAGNIVLGGNARLSTGTASGAARNIILGYGAGRSETGAPADRLIVESLNGGTSGTLRSMFYGSLATGNIIIGNGPLADRDLASLGTNCVKIPNGTIGGINPANGGYFYVVAGALHWVGSAGTDTVLAPA